MPSRWLTRAALALVLLLSTAAAGAARPNPTALNLGFEAGDSLGIPTGWIFADLARQAGYVPSLGDSVPFEGTHFSRTVSAGPRGDVRFSTVMQGIDARPWRGRRFVLRSHLRYLGSGVPGAAQMWARVDCKGGSFGFFDNMDDRPVRAPLWTTATIVGTIDDSAQVLAIGYMLVGGGEADADGFSLEIAPAETCITTPVDARALANLVAYTRLLGYVRLFDASDASAATDWNAFACATITSVEGCRDAAALARTLRETFAPRAPGLIVATGRMPAHLDTLPPAAGSSGYRAWRQYGFPTVPNQAVYHRERVWVPAGTPPPADLPVRGSFVAADLGGGVWCRVPIAADGDSSHTLPVSDSPPLPPRPPSTAVDRATRFADVALAWTVLRHFYPYWDVVHDDWDRALEQALSRSATDRNAREHLETLERMWAHLHDGHGAVSGPGERFAYAPMAWDWAGEHLVVTAVDDSLLPGTHVGDEVVAVGGVPTATAAARAAERISGATPGWIHARLRYELFTAAGLDTLPIRLLDAAGRTHEVAIPLRRDIAPPRAARPDTIVQLRPGIWYVDLTRSNAVQFEAHARDFAAARGLIYDVRGYPGRLGTVFLSHLADTALTCDRWNVPIVRYPDGHDLRFDFSNWSAPPRAPRFTARVAFLTDGSAISYAETCMGIAESHHLGEIVGEPTAGTNGNVIAFDLPGGNRVRYTGMRVLKYDGSQHHGVGIRPTVPVSPTVAGIRAGRDEVLDRGGARPA